MGILDRLRRGRVVDRVPVDATQQQPIAPFERWKDAPRFLQLPRQLFRPVVYVMQHQELPDSLRLDPRLLGELHASASRVKKYWWRSAQRAVREGYWTPAVLHHERITEYMDTLIAHTTVTERELDRHWVWSIAMPSPVDVIECHFVVVCVAKPSHGESLPHTRRRYFTLERTATPAKLAFCEWAPGVHRNLGISDAMSQRAFEEACVARVLSEPAQ